jgi:23S rRNA pseudouridine1911/1915/1917 synthase
MTRGPVLDERRLLYLDADLAVVDKPAGLLSQEHAGEPHQATVVHALAGLLRRRGESARLFAVHRLDEDTSGTLVVARTETARRALEALFESHDLDRIYHAVVLGQPRQAQGRLESRLSVGRDGVVRVVRRGGEFAVTHYATVAAVPGGSVLACRLETGRRNQIRVQLADVGHPVAGDRKYGRHHPAFERVRAPRPLLHATAISLPHPTSGEALTAIAPFPDDFRALLGDELCRRLLPG